MVNGFGNEQRVQDRMVELRGSMGPRRVRSPRRIHRPQVAWRRRVAGIIGV